MLKKIITERSASNANAMPMSQPPIPRSTSSPNLPSECRRSVCSAASRSPTKFSFWPTWGRKSSAKQSQLTEERLDAHNRRIIHHVEKYANCSPYYRGLTDSSLALPRLSSPGRESCHHAAASTTTATTSASFSSFRIKMQEYWTASCFVFKFKHDFHAFEDDPPVITNTNVNANADVSATNHLDAADNLPTKPLRESDTATSLVKESPCVIVTEDDIRDKEFIWANNFQPKSLKDFICNRDKATQLQGLVSEIHLISYPFNFSCYYIYQFICTGV